jgi:hypothetical protein
VQNDVVDGGDPDRAGYAAISFVTFRDVFVLEEAWASEAGQRTIIGDVSTFALASACAACASGEWRVVW